MYLYDTLKGDKAIEFCQTSLNWNLPISIWMQSTG